jgi:hypothetical protein
LSNKKIVKEFIFVNYFLCLCVMNLVKVKYCLFVVVFITALTSCQKGGEPVPYGESDTQLDEVFEYSNSREGDGTGGDINSNGNVYSPGSSNSSGSGSGGGETVIGGDDNEDDDDTVIGGGDIVVGGGDDDDGDLGDIVLGSGGK